MGGLFAEFRVPAPGGVALSCSIFLTARVCLHVPSRRAKLSVKLQSHYYLGGDAQQRPVGVVRSRIHWPVGKFMLTRSGREYGCASSEFSPMIGGSVAA